MSEQYAIHIADDEIRLRFRQPDFTDTLVRGLISTPRGGSIDQFHIEPWSKDRIALWRVSKQRFDRYGRHVAALIRWCGRSTRGTGLVQRGAERLNVPLFDPPKRPTLIESCRFESASAGLAWETPS